MRKLIKLTIGAAMVLCVLVAVSSRRGSFATQQQNDVRVLTAQERAIKVSITTGGGLFGPPKTLYHVGQRVPVNITMTNTSDQPVEVCVSDTLYQDSPQLVRDGQPVPYLALEAQMVKADQKYKTCSEINVPETFILQPKEARVVDWFILADGRTIMGDMPWYAPLQAGKYELTDRRRLSCCDGPMVESNKISFEVVP
jgi:hypothetical protein